MESFEKRVSLAQAELKAPKNQYNDFGKYHYRSCEDILEAAKPINSKYGLFLTLTDDISMRGDRIYISATATLSDTESEKHLCVTAYAREPEAKKGMDESQITGTASSYARKYALNGLYCIDDTKDADTNEHKKEKDAKSNDSAPSKPTAAVTSPPQTRESYFCESCGKEINSFLHNNQMISARQAAFRSKEKYGKTLCIKCANKVNESTQG